MPGPTSGSFVDNRINARLDRPREMAQPVARAFLPCRVCRRWGSLLSTLGHSQALWNHCVCWRRSLASSLGPMRTYAGGAGPRLNVDSMPHAALVMNYSKDFAAPDQAAAATAIATGEKVANRALAVSSDGK